MRGLLVVELELQGVGGLTERVSGEGRGRDCDGDSLGG
jgi:hypothetical protein